MLNDKKTLEHHRYTLVEVEPGKTATANIGGTGRPVIGRVAGVDTNDPAKKIDWSGKDGARVSAQYSRTDRPAMQITDLPKGHERLPQAEQRRIQREWEKTPRGKAAKRLQWSEPVIIFNPDGSFRIDDLVPGRYQIQFRKHLTENNFGIDMVESWKEFTVPEIPGGRSDEPLDIGVVAAKLRPVIVPGQPAPEFALRSLDGKPVKLSDFRGKYVVVKWWWPWSQLETEAEAMRDAYETIRDDVNFVLISIGLDDEIETTKKRVADHKLPGVQLHCRRNSEDFPREYLASPSTLCIIGPDGKVIARNLVPEAAETEIAKVRLERK
jgi:peroxiredoxin